ncbi:hypothetical protein FKR81_02605 [Lentzea tibetensis]|uniref:Uncharacterized protein n=1 Tax=Lentzea tibetensis TaxID=2591470 RepID=A0A563F177_9PSEU|nr:hypothetical protein [Lentzea tibetensis]TWP53669.1 hypothetical protein FKR81_02605 [Lentzea tibetensis]
MRDVRDQDQRIDSSVALGHDEQVRVCGERFSDGAGTNAVLRSIKKLADVLVCFLVQQTDDVVQVVLAAL